MERFCQRLVRCSDCDRSPPHRRYVMLQGDFYRRLLDPVLLHLQLQGSTYVCPKTGLQPGGGHHFGQLGGQPGSSVVGAAL